VIFARLSCFHDGHPRSRVDRQTPSFCQRQSNNRPSATQESRAASISKGQPVFVTYMTALKTSLRSKRGCRPNRPRCGRYCRIIVHSLSLTSLLYCSQVLHPKPCSKAFALVQAFSLTFSQALKGQEVNLSTIAPQGLQVRRTATALRILRLFR
jgi:hypothetical protein